MTAPSPLDRFRENATGEGLEVTVPHASPTTEPPPPPEFDPDDVPEPDRSGEPPELTAVVEGISVVDAYLRWGGTTDVGLGASGEVQVSCPLPDHPDEHPSASLNVDRDLWHCHRCNIGGDKFIIAAHHFGIPTPVHGAAFPALRRLMGEEFGWSPPPAPRFPSAAATETPSTTTPASTATDWPRLADEALFGLAGDVVRALDPYTESDPVAILVQLFTAFGNAIGRGSYFVVEDDRHYGNLFAVLVGDSSKARKGTSWRRVRKLIEEVDHPWATRHVVSGLSSGEGVVHRVRDEISTWKPGSGSKPGELVVTDPGVDDKRLLVIEQEYASVLKTINGKENILSPMMREAWDGNRLERLTKLNPVSATGAHLSVIGHITDGELRRYLTTTEVANGFGNRHLWFLVRRTKLLPFGGTPPAALLDPLIARLRDAYATGTSGGEVGLDDAARQLWIDRYPTLSDGRPGTAGALTSRGEAQVRRIAMLYALLDTTTIVEEVHLRAALALWDYAERSVTALFGTATGDPVLDALVELLANATRPLSRTDIRNAFSHHRPADIDRAIVELQAKGRITVDPVATGGRPAQMVTWVCT